MLIENFMCIMTFLEIIIFIMFDLWLTMIFIVDDDYNDNVNKLPRERVTIQRDKNYNLENIYFNFWRILYYKIILIYVNGNHHREISPWKCLGLNNFEQHILDYVSYLIIFGSGYLFWENFLMKKRYAYCAW